jgi:putative ABC transport system permease protein
MFLNLMLDTGVTGLPYVLPFFGVLVVFRLLDRIDLTIDGSFVLGAATATVAVHAGVPAWASIAVAIAAGAVAGLVTTCLHVLLQVPVLLAGIVMWIGLYSINLRVMGRPTLALAAEESLYGALASTSRDVRDVCVVVILTLVIGVVLVLMARFLRTELGLAVRTIGVNAGMARSQGVDERVAVAVGLAGANGLAALGGALVAHGQGFAEVNMGTGVMIAGIAAVLLGELFFRPAGSAVGRRLIAIVVGALAYRLILLSALRAGLPASDLRLVTAVTLALTLVIDRCAHRVTMPLARRRHFRSAGHRSSEAINHAAS